MSHQRRRIVIDSDDDMDMDNTASLVSSVSSVSASANGSVVIKTPAAKSASDPIISANSHTVEKTSPSCRGRPNVTVSKCDESSDDELGCSGQQIIDIMHGQDGPIASRRSRRYGRTKVIHSPVDILADSSKIDGDTNSGSELCRRPATPQFTTSAAHTAGTPPAQQVDSSRRSSRLAKGPSQDKVDLRRKLMDLRGLRTKGKMSVGGLHDSSSGSEDLEIQAMAAKHQRESRKRMKQRSSRLDQQEDSNDADSDDRIIRHFGRNHVEPEVDDDLGDLNDMSNFIVDDEEDVYEEAGEVDSRRSRKNRKRATDREKKYQRCKRRVHYESDSDDENDGDSNFRSDSNHVKRYRQAPVLQVVSERKRKRRVLTDDDEESGGDEDSMANHDSIDETELSEDSTAIDHRRQRKKGKVQKYCPLGRPSAEISPLVTINGAKRGRKSKRASSSKSKIRSRLKSSRKIIHDDDDDSGVSGDESNSEDDEDDESSSYGDEVVDGFSMYRQLDILRQEQDDCGIEVAPTEMFRKSLCTSESMRVYIEMLLCLLTDADYRAKYGECTEGALHVGMSVSRSDQARIRAHCSAARTIENLICTSRESLLGSSVWKGEFFHELTSRPFFDVQFTRNIHEHTCGEKTDDRGKERGLERCDACGRENKTTGGYKLHLFGPTYDASGLWNSRRWVEKLPPTILKSMTRYMTTTASNVIPSSSSIHSSGEYASRSSNLKTPGSRQQAVASANFKSDVKRMLHLQANLKPLTQDEGDDDDDDDDDEEDYSDRGVNSPSVALSSALLKRVSISGNPSPQRHLYLLDDDSEGDETSIPWWQRKWGRDLVAEPETKWVVNSHCKRRTQLYHLLLHYKFRLILKIRERVRQKALKRGPLSPLDSKGNSGDKGVSVIEALGDGFVAAEVERFESLLQVAGRQFGGEEHATYSIWSDNEDDLSVKSRKVSLSSGIKHHSTSSGCGRSSQRKAASTGSSGGRRKVTSTLDKWLTFTPVGGTAPR